jgi:DNA uptake protein ComE-like DNA-binding protein
MRVAAYVRVAGIAAVLGGCAVQARQLDLNSASPAQLAKLPGIGRAEAERIVAERPFMTKDDLIRRRLVSREQFDEIARDLYVGPPGIPDFLKSVPPMPEVE